MLGNATGRKANCRASPPVVGGVSASPAGVHNRLQVRNWWRRAASKATRAFAAERLNQYFRQNLQPVTHPCRGLSFDGQKKQKPLADLLTYHELANKAPKMHKLANHLVLRSIICR